MKINDLEDVKLDSLKERKPLVYEKCLKFKDKLLSGESIAIIQFQYNYVCNLKCQHCSILKFQKKFANKQKFTIEKVKKLAQEADELGLARFVITGGEPLVFKDFDQIVEAIDPHKFYINVDTNGWFLDEKKALHLKSVGIDRIQLSIDSLDEKEHDDFRNQSGSYKRAMNAVEACRKVGLDLFIQTVVTKQRLYSKEFVKFVEMFNKKGITVFVTYAKPVVAWEGKYDMLINKDDMNYMRELEKTHNLCTHLTPAYGRDMGCIAVKGMISVTEYGDVLPCPYIHTSIGNVFEEPLKDIIQRGMDIKFFGEYADTCWIAEDIDFITQYVEKHIYNKELPVDCREVFSEKDKTQVPFNETMKKEGKI